MITQSDLKNILSYNPEAGIFTWINTSSRKKINGKQAGGLQLTGYIAIRINRKKYTAHRLAWLYVHGVMPEDCIDHINGDRADNRICNLRPASRKENNQNVLRSFSNKTGYMGVMWRARENKWLAKIKVDGKNKHIGYFDSKEEAHLAYLEAKRKYHPFFSG